MWPLMPSDVKNIPEAFGGQHTHFCTIMLDGYIGRYSCAMNNGSDFTTLNPSLFAYLNNALEDTN